MTHEEAEELFSSYFYNQQKKTGDFIKEHHEVVREFHSLFITYVLYYATRNLSLIIASLGKSPKRHILRKSIIELLDEEIEEIEEEVKQSHAIFDLVEIMMDNERE